MNIDIIFLGVCIIVAIIMLIYYSKRKNYIISVLTGSLSGFLVLNLVSKYGLLIDIDLQLNAFNTIGSSLLGVPFVLCLIILKQI